MAEVLRVRQTDDLELIHDLDRQLFPFDAPIAETELCDSLWWLATLAGHAVGFAGLLVTSAALAVDGVDLHPRKGFLCRAGVLPVARGAGLQVRMIRARVAYANRIRVPRVYTYVAASNVASMRSLVKCGFMPYYTERPVDTTFIYLEKHLARPRLPLVLSGYDIRTADSPTPAAA